MTKYKVGAVLVEVPKDKRKKKSFFIVWSRWLTKASMFRAVANAPRGMSLKIAVR